MEQPVQAGTVFRVRCICGGEAAIDLGAFGLPHRCRDCSGLYKVVWGIDPKSRKKVPVTVRESDTSKGVFKVPPGAQELVCRCGQQLLARPDQVGKRVLCPVCSRWMKLERTRDPQTLETRIRVVESRINRLPAVPPATTKSPSGPPDSQRLPEDILCTCGESLRVEREHLGKQAQCPACGTLMRLDQKRDPETSRIIVLPRVVGQGAPPQKRGIEEDLSLDDFH